MQDLLNSKLNHISGKVLAVLFTILLSISAMLYSDGTNRITILEDRVSNLVYDKVSRSELKDDLNQLRLQNERNKSDILARQESMKEDILARLELMTVKR